MWDPLYRGPLLATLLMGLSSSLVGVLAFIRRRSLLGESLSHATYPGVALSALLLGGQWGVLALALASALVGLLAIEWLTRRCRVREDAALCMVLATFFGVGLTLASALQKATPLLYRQVQLYLYGQAATMGDLHILLYGSFSLLVIVTLFLLYKELQCSSLDRSYSQSLGMPVRFVDGVVFALVLLAVVGGIRAVGLVLMSAMLVAPPAAARQWTQSLSTLFWVSGLVGAVSGLVGAGLSIATPVPTGAGVVLVATLLALGSLVLAPERGLLMRALRIGRFRLKVKQENLLKRLWKGERAGFAPLLRMQGWVTRVDGTLQLTADGERRAQRIIRLHRLWEVYLVDRLGVGVARVHKSAEEMEHIITPELERELSALLDDPKTDPHRQPIPPAQEVL